jgi:hypothetical protein
MSVAARNKPPKSYWKLIPDIFPGICDRFEGGTDEIRDDF